MIQPSFQVEERLWKKGYKRVAGLDEVGRGALAGPVVAAAVILKNPKLQAPNYKQVPMTKIQNSKQKSFGHSKIGLRPALHLLNLCLGHISDLFGICNLEFGISNLRDSKKLSPKIREIFYQIFTTHPQIEWAIGRVSEKVIDKINIKNAAELAMEKAILNLKEKPDFLIIDGKHLANLKLKTYNLKLITKADEKVFSCTIASILAKVTRDRIMQRVHKKYPRYGFDKNKGYPTKLHRRMLKKYGKCAIHRKSFKYVCSAKTETYKIKEK